MAGLSISNGHEGRVAVDEGIARTVIEARETIREILAGRDRRMLCIVGPCSIHETCIDWPTTEQCLHAAVTALGSSPEISA